MPPVRRDVLDSCFSSSDSSFSSSDASSVPKRPNPRPKKQYACLFGGCGYQTPFLNALTTHSPRHQGRKPHVCWRQWCSFKSRTYEGLQAHRREAHGHVKDNGSPRPVSKRPVSQSSPSPEEEPHEHESDGEDGESDLGADLPWMRATSRSRNMGDDLMTFKDACKLKEELLSEIKEVIRNEMSRIVTNGELYSSD